MVDPLEYLDPDPNPLLLQTQPEEVEIIGIQPLTLEEVIELAYRNNPDLRVALLELEQSQAVLREARAALLPTVTLSGTVQGQNSQSTSFGATGLTSNEEIALATSGQLNVTYNVYSSGQRDATIRTAEEQVRLSELEVERRQEVLRLNTINEYYDLQRSTEQIRISQAFLSEAERNLRDTQLREEVGVGTRFDVLRAEVQTANARQQLRQAESDRQTTQRTLARRLNLPPSLDVIPVPVDIAGSWPLGLEDSIVLAYQNRAELEQQLVQREIGEQQRRIALSALGPQVDLFATYGVQDVSTQNNRFTDTYSVGAQVSWTLFEGGAAAARAQQRELDIAIADRQFEETRNGIRLDVEQSYFSLQANRDNIDTAELAVEQAEEALRLAILRFEAGVGTQLDVISAQADLTEAEVNLVDAKIGYNRALAALERATSNLPERYYEALPY
ncbi:MAG: TolC family protein [Cyanobacteria bacterium]|nr:TolC family protein [Cyanobacteriota bacterium]